MDVAYHVNKLKITDEIIKEFGEPPKTYAKKVLIVALIIDAITLMIAMIATSFIIIDPKIYKKIYFPAAGLFWGCVFTGFIVHAIVKEIDENKILSYKYRVWTELMKNKNYARKTGKAEKRRQERQEEIDAEYDIHMSDLEEEEALRQLQEEEEQQRFEEEEREYLEISLNNLD